MYPISKFLYPHSVPIFLVLGILTGCLHDSEAEKSELCSGSSLDNFVQKNAEINNKRVVCPGGSVGSSNGALIKLNSGNGKDPRITAWKGNDKVDIYSRKTWSDNAGYYNFISFKNLEEGCIQVESVRTTRREWLIYSKRHCSYRVKKSVVKFKQSNRVEPDSFKWEFNTECPKNKTCDRMSASFNLIASDSENVLKCVILKLSDPNNVLKCE